MHWNFFDRINRYKDIDHMAHDALSSQLSLFIDLAKIKLLDQKMYSIDWGRCILFFCSNFKVDLDFDLIYNPRILESINIRLTFNIENNKLTTSSQIWDFKRCFYYPWSSFQHWQHYCKNSRKQYIRFSRSKILCFVLIFL